MNKNEELYWQTVGWKINAWDDKGNQLLKNGEPTAIYKEKLPKENPNAKI